MTRRSFKVQNVHPTRRAHGGCCGCFPVCCTASRNGLGSPAAHQSPRGDISSWVGRFVYVYVCESVFVRAWKLCEFCDKPSLSLHSVLASVLTQHTSDTPKPSRCPLTVSNAHLSISAIVEFNIGPLPSRMFTGFLDAGKPPGAPAVTEMYL